MCEFRTYSVALSGDHPGLYTVEIETRIVARSHVVLLGRIASLDGELHSYARVLETTALSDAQRADAEIKSGRYRGPLHGVPIAVKDLCWIQGEPTGAGTTVHKDSIAKEDATVVRRMKDAGAVLIGKPQLTEGAYSDHHPSITPPVNPWDADYWPGISSSGAGVATAAGLCYGSIVTDTGGSIRWPSAANGVTGLKPTWGRVSRHGVVELAASLDHVGTMARSAQDVGIMLGAIAGNDLKDPTALLDPVPDYSIADNADMHGKRVGIDNGWNRIDVDTETKAALSDAVGTFLELGAEIVEVRLPDMIDVVADWVPNCAVEAAVAHETSYRRHKEQYGSILASVIEAGQALSGTEYQKILLRRAAFRGQVDRVFDQVDLLLAPVQPFAPLSLAKIATLGEQPRLIEMLQRYTCPFNMSGHPTLTFPGGCGHGGMPIGLQLIAGRLQEATLLRAGAAYQHATTWHQRHPSPPTSGSLEHRDKAKA